MSELLDLLPLPAQELKAQLPLAFVCHELGIYLDRDGTAPCPFHDDTSPSFYLWEGDDGLQRWWCQPCGFGGDIFDLIKHSEGLGFPQAVGRAQQMYAKLPPGFDPPPTRSAPPVSITSFIGRIDAARHYAAEQGLWNAHVRDVWGWGQDEDGVIYMPHWSGASQPRLTGCKIRKPDGSKSSLPGSRYESLYGSWLRREHGAVILCEGESDAVHAGLQRPDADVYALPRGAGAAIQPEWVEFLKDAILYLAFDGDDAGRRATVLWRTEFPQAKVLPIPEGQDLRSSGTPIALLTAKARQPYGTLQDLGF